MAAEVGASSEGAAPAASVLEPDATSDGASDGSGGRRASMGEMGFMDVGDLGDSQFQGYFGDGKEFDDLDFGGGSRAASTGAGMGSRSRSFDGLATMLTDVLGDDGPVRRSVRAVSGAAWQRRRWCSWGKPF